MYRVFWECRKLKHFWKAVHDLTVRVLEITLDITPIRYLFGTDLDRTLDLISVKRIGIVYIAKNQQRPPTLNLFKKILNETLRLEQRNYTSLLSSIFALL